MELSITNWKQWLKASYSETPTDGPDSKWVKFSDIHESLIAQFPTDTISKQMASRAIQEAFPNTEKQRLGREKNTYIVGIQPPVQVHPSNSIEVLQAQNQQLTETVHQLQVKIRELEEPKSTTLDTLLPSMMYSYSCRCTFHRSFIVIHDRRSSSSKFTDFCSQWMLWRSMAFKSCMVQIHQTTFPSFQWMLLVVSFSQLHLMSINCFGLEIQIYIYIETNLMMKPLLRKGRS